MVAIGCFGSGPGPGDTSRGQSGHRWTHRRPGPPTAFTDSNADLIAVDCQGSGPAQHPSDAEPDGSTDLRSGSGSCLHSVYFGNPVSLEGGDVRNHNRTRYP